MKLVAEAKLRVPEIAMSEVHAALGTADLLIDVREAEEFVAGHLAGAVHMSRGTLEFKLAGNPAYQAADTSIILYCKTSGRAALAGASLLDMGYTDVRLIAGGFDAWVAGMHPVEK